MSGQTSKATISRSLFSIKGYLGFFLLISSIVTCTFLIFLSSIELTKEMIQESAVATFINVLFLSLICTLIDGIRRKFTMERPVKSILDATHRLTQGDFSVRIKPFHGITRMNEFDVISENFNKMAEELSNVETLRTDFIANVSHELKTPLAIIQNYATMLQDPSLPEERQIEYAKTVTGASRRLSDLITNILKLNKLESQQIFPDVQEYDLGEQLCECLLNFEDSWELKSLEIETDIAENVMIRAEAELLSLVWNNLFSNAVKFMPEGGKLTVSLKTNGADAVVQVSDTGCGMSPETGAHIFEKFYQGDKSHATQGNGLGLALVKRVIDIFSGEISVDSMLGKGSTFTVRLSRNGNEDA